MEARVYHHHPVPVHALGSMFLEWQEASQSGHILTHMETQRYHFAKLFYILLLLWLFGFLRQSIKEFELPLTLLEAEITVAGS